MIEDYISENIKLLYGDCLERMKEIPDKSIDMILCDLPYGITSAKWDIVIPFEPLWEQYNRIIKDNGAIILFGSEPFSSYLRLSNIKKYRYDLVWKKSRPSNFQLAKKQPMKYHENIIVFYNKQPKYNPIMIETGIKNKKISKNNKTTNNITGNYIDFVSNTSTKRYPKSILEFKSVCNSHNRYHSTQKPIDLLKYLIKTYTNEGETVLDNCMGSGTTGVACKKLNRNFIGIEIDTTYFNIAKERIAKFESQENLFDILNEQPKIEQENLFKGEK